MTNVIAAANASFQHSGHIGPAAVLKTIDRWLRGPLSSSEGFVTLVVGSLEPQTGELRLSNAGHSPVLYVLNGQPHSLPAHFPPVGVLEIDETREVTVHLQEGDLFVSASDGLSEQQNPEGQMFGDDRFSEFVTMNTDRCPAEIGASLFDRVEEFAGGTSQADDRTLLCIRLQPMLAPK